MFIIICLDAHLQSTMSWTLLMGSLSSVVDFLRNCILLGPRLCPFTKFRQASLLLLYLGIDNGFRMSKKNIIKRPQETSPLQASPLNCKQVCI